MLFVYKLPPGANKYLFDLLLVYWLNDIPKRMIANDRLLNVIITSVMVSTFTLMLL